MLFAVDARWVKDTWRGTSLMVQWLSIHPPMQGTRVRSLVPEDSTCCRTTNPVVTLLSSSALEPVICNKRSHGSEKPVCHN